MPDFDLRDFLPLNKFLETYGDQFSENAMRWLLRFADTNGLVEEGAALKFQGRWWINTKIFPRYMMNHHQAAA